MRCNKGFAFALAFSMALGYSSSALAQEDDEFAVFGDSAEEKAEVKKAEDKAEAVVEAEAAPAAEAPAVEAPAAEAPAAEAPAAEEPAVEAPAAETPAAEAPAAEEPAAETPAAEAPAAEEPAAVAEEPAEEPAPAAAVEEPSAEPAPAPAAEEPAAEEPAAADDMAEPAPAAVAEEPAEEPAPAAVEEPAPAAAAEPAPAVKTVTSEAEALLAEIDAAEALRRATLDEQAMEEIAAADLAFTKRDWDEAFRQYELASRHLNDRPSTAELREKCRTRMAESKYQCGRRAVLEGNREEAIKNYEDAVKLHHEQAIRDLNALKAETRQEAEKDVSAIVHRINDKEYKGSRDTYRKRLRKARQYYTTAEFDKAFEECELVLRTHPNNEEALRLRELISQRVNRIERRELLVTREEMMHQVNRAWRPVYAPDSAQLDAVDGGTASSKPLEPGNLSQEQGIEKRMRGIKLPSVSFRPPATLVDAVEYFRQASKDFDLPDVPAEERGINFVLRLNSTLTGDAGAAAADDDAFGSSASSDDQAASASGPVPQIPAITASNISLWQALDQVCQVTGYKFQISGPFVVVMPKDATIDVLETRTYNVLDMFVDRVSSAASDIRESRGGFGGGNTLEASDGGDQQRDWKQYFADQGVAWPPNSSISYIKTTGKLRVTNTAENLAVFEQALNDLNVTPTLVEIETRFVEVSQEDLNSLGFEWLLNSDYTLNVGNKLGRILGLKPGVFNNVTSGGTTTTTTTSGNTVTTYEGGIAVSEVVDSGSTTTTTSGGTTSTRWQRMPYRSKITKTYDNGTTWTTRRRNHRNLGLNAFGGNSDYQNNNRFLSTVGNPISGAGESNNDRFMQINGFLGNADLSLILHMLSQRTDTDLLSAPKVVTKSGQQAIIKVVTEYIYPQDYDVTIETSGSSGGGGWGGNNGGGGQILAMVEPQNFTMREVGVILDVTPEVTAEGSMINLDLKPQVVDEPVWHDYGMMVPNTSSSGNSLLQGLQLDLALQNLEDLTGLADLLGAEKEQEYYKVPMEQPFFHVRSIETHLSIYNGATVVMGGLITEERKAMDDKVPFLGDIPFIGRLFRSRSEWSNKRNLLIFVTARLVDPRGRKVNIGSGDEVAKTGSAGGALVPVTQAPAPEE